MQRRIVRSGGGAGTGRGLTLALGVLMLAPVAAAETADLEMSDKTRAMLEAVLDDERMEMLEQTLSHPEAWGSLGPNPTGAPEPLPVDPPEREVELVIPDDAEGSGTADDPYIDVISDFLAQYEYEPTSIEAYRSYPDAEEIEQYMETVAHAPKRVRVPAGHYRESARTESSPHRHYDERIIAVDVPPGIWLEGEGEVVIEPAVEPETRSSLINLNIRSGLVNFTLDGSDVPGWEPQPETRVNGIKTAHEAVIADNVIHHFSGHGIIAAGSRARAGSDVVVSNNIIDTIGYGGITSGSRWRVRDNQVRYAGLLRPTGGGGDDGIKPAWAVEGEIVNNLFILERRPHGRHVISGQTSHDHLVAGNISITNGPLRNNIGWSDGSHRNRFIGNAALGAGKEYDGGNTLTGISVNGYGAEIRHNFVVGHPRGVRARGREGEAPGIIADNYVESMVSDIYRSSYYEASNNTFRRTGERHATRRYSSPLEDIDAADLEERFGLFRRAER